MSGPSQVDAPSRPVRWRPAKFVSRDESRHFLALMTLAAVLISLVGHRQLFIPVSFNSQDHVDGYVRALEYASEWANGHWAQSLPHAYFGGGDAFPRFYPPLSHLTAAATYMLVGDPILAVHLTGLLAIALGCVFLALLVHRLTTSAILAGVASVIFGLFPYAFLQLQVRGAFAEAWGAAWYPLIMLAALWSADTRRLHPMYPIAIALLMLTHTVMTLWTLPVLLAVVVAAGPERRLAIRHAAIACAIGVLLAGFHLVSLATGVPRVRAADPEVLHATTAALMGANQQYGVADVPALIFPAFLVLGAFAVRLALRARNADPARLLGFAAMTGAFLLAAMIVAPELVWRMLPQQLLYIQFPIRLLSPVSFLLILALIVIPRWTEWPPSNMGRIGLLTAGIIAALLAGHRALMPRSLTGAHVRTLMRSEFSALGFNVDQAFLPRGTDPKEIAAHILRLRDMVGGQPLIRWDTDGPDPIAELDLPDSARVTLPLVRQDFLVPRLAEGGTIVVDSDQGLLAVSLPPGRHTIIVGRRIPPAIAWGMVVSTLTTGLLCVWWLQGRRGRSVGLAPGESESA